MYHLSRRIVLQIVCKEIFQENYGVNVKQEEAQVDYTTKYNKYTARMELLKTDFRKNVYFQWSLKVIILINILVNKTHIFHLFALIYPRTFLFHITQFIQLLSCARDFLYGKFLRQISPLKNRKKVFRFATGERYI